MTLPVRIAVSLVLFAAATVQAQSDFYASRLQRGLLEYQRGQFAQAAQDLRIGAFGLLDDAPEYENAQIHALLALEKLNRTSDAATTAAKILQAERIQPSYAALQLDPATRAQFETDLRKLVAPAQLAKVTAFAPLVGAAAPPPAPVPAASAPQPSPVPIPRPPTLSVAQRAAAALQAGDFDGARKLADTAVANDYPNALAQTVLAQLGWRAGDWNAVTDHYSIVRTRRRLTNDENAEFYAAMLRSGRTVDAEGVRRLLPASVLASSVVTQAVAAVQPKSVAPAPVPVPQPVAAPQPRVVPAPVSQPQPQPEPSTGAGTAPGQPARTPTFQSPLVAIARHQPSDAAAVHDVATALIDADNLLREGRIASAREMYLKLTIDPSVNRDLALEIGKGLNRTSAFRASSLQYQKLYPLHHGEEMHMLYEAENRYELGDVRTAREILSVALPYLPKTKEVELYRSRIEARR